MNKEETEELAFKDRKELAKLNELDLLEIIEFLQLDRKQWINQYSTAHNDYVDLQRQYQQLKEIEKEHQRINGELREEIKDYQKELEKADSITQSCIFNGKKESEISYRKALNELEKTNKANQELKEDIKYSVPIVEHNKVVTNIVKENRKLKDRIDKAKKYIEQYKEYNAIPYDLEEILKGDKE